MHVFCGLPACLIRLVSGFNKCTIALRLKRLTLIGWSFLSAGVPLSVAVCAIQETCVCATSSCFYQCLPMNAGYSNRARVAGPQRCQNHHDLHPCAQSRRWRHHISTEFVVTDPIASSILHADDRLRPVRRKNIKFRFAVETSRHLTTHEGPDSVFTDYRRAAKSAKSGQDDDKSP